MNVQKKLKSNIYKLCAYWFFHNFIFAYVIERLFWEQRGMTVQQVVYTEIIYAAVIILLEVPTGSLADKWSKKNLMVINSFLSIFEFVILIYANSFWHFALAVFLAAIGKALSSGTSNAILYDSLKLLGEENKFEKVLGLINFFDYFAGMLAALIGSYVAYRHNYVSTYWLSLISTIIAFVITLTLYEPNIKRSNEELNYTTYIKEAFKFLKNEPSIKFVLLFGMIIGACLTYVDEFWQLYLKEIKIPVIYFGIVSASRSLSSSISGIFAHKLKERFSYNTLFSLVITFSAFSLIVCSLTDSALGLIPLIITFMLCGIVDTLVSGYLHHRTDSTYRATVESFQSLISRVFIIGVGLLFGFFSTNYSIFIGFRALGIFAAIYAIYYMIFKNKYL